jgi:hypothetical protein
MCESFTALTISAMNKKSKDFFESLLSFFAFLLLSVICFLLITLTDRCI